MKNKYYQAITLNNKFRGFITGDYPKHLAYKIKELPEGYKPVGKAFKGYSLRESQKEVLSNE